MTFYEDSELIALTFNEMRQLVIIYSPCCHWCCHKFNCLHNLLVSPSGLLGDLQNHYQWHSRPQVPLLKSNCSAIDYQIRSIYINNPGLNFNSDEARYAKMYYHNQLYSYSNTAPHHYKARQHIYTLLLIA